MSSPRRNHTHKQKRAKVQEEVVKEKGFLELRQEESIDLNKHDVFRQNKIQKMYSYHKYMVNNFESMFDSELSIKHFHIRPGLFGLWSDADDIKEEYSKNIQLDCILWIKNELIKEQLFNSTNWIPIQDSDDYTEMFLGYKRMYQYKQYYFQLALEENCSECINCYDCKNNNFTIHFELAYYGWKDEQHKGLQPLQYFIVSSDNMIPEQFWKT